MTTFTYSGNFSGSPSYNSPDGNDSFLEQLIGSASLTIDLTNNVLSNGTETTTATYTHTFTDKDGDAGANDSDDPPSFTTGQKTVSGNVSISGSTVNISNFFSATDPSGGTISASFSGTLSSDQNSIGGVITYTDSRFNFTPAPAVSFAFVRPNTNHDPVAVNDTYTVPFNTQTVLNVLSNDFDPDSGETSTLTIVQVSQPGIPHGSVVVSADHKSLTYTPNLNYSGPDALISYEIQDVHGGIAFGTVNVTVAAPNLPPVANPDSATTAMNQAVTIDVLANDTDDGGQANLIVAGIPQSPQHGTVSIPAGSKSVIYTPNAGYSGSDTFTYTASDQHGGTAVGTVTVSVTPPTVTIVQSPEPDALEGGTNGADVVHFNVTVSNPTSSPITVHYATQDVTAHANVDYTPVSGTLTIPANTASAVIDVHTIDNSTKDGDRTFELVLSSPTNAQLPGGVSSQLYTAVIHDDDTLAPIPSNLPSSAEWQQDPNDQVAGHHLSETSPDYNYDPATDTWFDPQGNVIAKGTGTSGLFDDMADEAKDVGYNWLEEKADALGVGGAYRLAKGLYDEAKNKFDQAKQLTTVFKNYYNSIFNFIENGIDNPDGNATDATLKNDHVTFLNGVSKYQQDHGNAADVAVTADELGKARLSIEELDNGSPTLPEQDSALSALAATGELSGIAALPSLHTLSFKVDYDDRGTLATIVGAANKKLTFIGSDGNDTVIGANLADTLYGGAGNDVLYGQGGNDKLIGGDGNDFLDGGTGVDSMFGGTGNDTYYVDNLGDVVTENPNEGTDTVHVTISGYTLPANVEIGIIDSASGVALYANNQGSTLYGNSGNDVLIGGTGNDAFSGGAGNDVIDGGVGADAMAGGTGNDIYYVDNLGDTVYENPNEGIDTIHVTVNGYALGPNIEVGVVDSTTGLTLYGNNQGSTLYGNSGNDTLIGGAGNDAFSGGAGNDIIDGAFGADAMAGGTGNDTYYVDNLGDTVYENPNEGIDTVHVTVNGYALGSNIEVGVVDSTTGLTLYGNNQGSTLYGNSGNDVLIGGAGNDAFSGGAGNDIIDGALGADAMAGGTGNDTYYVDNLGDLVYENPNEGADTVHVTVNGYALGPNIEVGVVDSATGLTLYGNNQGSILYGNVGNDVLIGGAGNDAFSGGAGNDVIDGGVGADAMAGGIGNDIYYVDNLGDTVYENPNEGSDTIHVTVNGYALGPNIEVGIVDSTTGVALYANNQGSTLYGNSGNDVLIGGAGNDAFSGGAGNDVINGGIGADAMAGGTGNDTYYVDNLGDAVYENPNEGIDTVHVTVNSYVLGPNIEVGVVDSTTGLTLYGNNQGSILYGNVGNDVLIGGAGNDAFSGGAGNDYIDGGAGADGMAGGTGNDVYQVDNLGDGVYENPNEGIDTVGVTVSGYILPANVEIGVIGTATGLLLSANDAGNTLYGNSGNDILYGGAGNDTLIGGAGNDAFSGGAGNDIIDGGLGADAMAGGTGNDIYYVDNLGDTVYENPNEGSDTIHVTVNGYALGPNIEVGIIDSTTGMALYANNQGSTLYGNSGNDVLIGGAGNDAFSGGAGNDVIDGGIGADAMAGGAGNDIYYVDNLADLVYENPNEGADTVHVTVNGYALGANIEVGVVDSTTGLTLYGNNQGSILYGNVGNDVLIGGAGNDAFSGGAGDDYIDGGAGIDAMAGGLGNDTYIVDNLADAVYENSNEGTDTTRVTVSGYTLAANIEVGAIDSTAGLTLYANNQGCVLFGNSGDDTLIGGTGNDQFSGGAGNDMINGGLGSDAMFGNAGNDTFVFKHGDGIDVIMDFTHGQDIIDLTGYGISSFAQLQPLMTQTGADTFITFDSTNQIGLHAVDMTVLDQNDFHLHP